MRKRRVTVRVRHGKAKRSALRLFRLAACLLGIGAVALLLYLPGRSVTAEEQQRQLESAMNAYQTAQAENNRLRRQLDESVGKDFVESVARRDYGYCLYGEIIYEVENIDQLLPDQPFEVYEGSADEGGV